MSEPTNPSPVNFSPKSLAIGVVCIVVAQLLLVALRSAVALPFSTYVQQSIATALGVLAWFYVGAKMGA
jgi:hypothetical protein